MWGLKWVTDSNEIKCSEKFKGRLPGCRYDDSEIAKSHLRHMVGGKSSIEIPERLFSVTFQEKLGAFREFLEGLHPDWNISPTHYRNHGGSLGRVLMGFQVSDDEASVLDIVARLPGEWTEVTEDPFCQLFL